MTNFRKNLQEIVKSDSSFLGYMRRPKVTFLLIFLLMSSYAPLSSADEIHATSYTDAIDSQSTMT